MLDRFRRLLPHGSIRTLPSVDAYERWAARYPPRAHNLLMQTEEEAMLSLMPDLTGQIVLDLACGTGRYGLIAHECGAKKVVGLDNSLAMLQLNTQGKIALATSEAIPLPACSVDVVLCGLALGHLPQLMPVMKEINRVLKPGGKALISDFHPFVFLKGSKRTFTASDGSTYAVEHYVHLYMDYHRSTRLVGLCIEDVIESGIQIPGTDDHMPVVIVYRIDKSDQQAVQLST